MKTSQFFCRTNLNSSKLAMMVGWATAKQNYLKVIGTVSLIVFQVVADFFRCVLFIILFDPPHFFRCMDFVGLVEILYHWIRSKPSFQMNKLIRTNAQNKWIFLDNVIKSNRLWVVFGAAGSISASQASLGLQWIQCFVLVIAVIVFQFFSFTDYECMCVLLSIFNSAVAHQHLPYMSSFKSKQHSAQIRAFFETYLWCPETIRNSQIEVFLQWNSLMKRNGTRVIS